MAIISVRNRFSNEGMKGLVDRRADDNEVVTTRNAFKLIGVELKSRCFSTKDTSAVLVVEGDAKKFCSLKLGRSLVACLPKHTLRY